MRTKTRVDRRTLSSSLSADVMAWLIARGHSQAEIAQLLGVSAGFVSLVKARERSFTLDHMEALATALNIPVGALFLQVTEKDARTPEARAFLDATARLIRRTDDLRAMLRRKVAAG